LSELEVETKVAVEKTEDSVEEVKSEEVVEEKSKNQPETKKKALKNGELLIFTVVIITQLFT
jgi:hypothetical protein